VKSELKKKITRELKQNYQLYILVLLPLAFIGLFSLGPMYGLQIAFKKFTISKGILGSPWVGFDNFVKLFNNFMFFRAFKNTLLISVYSILAGFPIPIILALALNATKKIKLKKTVQMVTYAPYFISTVVMVGIILQFTDIRIGIVNQLLGLIGIKPIHFMGNAKLFSSVYVWTGIWQNAGWGSIIYVSVLSSIDQNLYEAAIVDGASAFQKILHIDLPSILPTAIILLILNVGLIMNVGFEKILLMQNSLNLSTSEVIQTYVYKVGIGGGSYYGATGTVPNYSLATAVGLFNSVVGAILLVSLNYVARTFGETSLW
jgi:putative aldouronate transport system permease protein